MHISPNDTNSYRYITLPNQLRALLICDPDAPKSAAALAVNVGHFDDPTDREGLAHYLEHMLFLGTEKYPNSGEFQSFINQHGGTHNAWTGTEHSCFFFDITTSAFEKALDRFAQFFTAPLFNKESLDKERQAIESEYKLKLNDDIRRLYQVHKETIHPQHPFAKFSVGNEQTLSDRNQVSIREEIMQFYCEHYSADLMTLAVIAPEPLDIQEQWITERFANVFNQQHRGKTVQEPYVTDKHTGLMIEVEPLKDIRKLFLSFPLPCMDIYYQQKPLSYFAHLLGYEGKDSLTQALKDKGWITSLSAGGGTSGSNYREFTISMLLTEAGMTAVETIIQAVFSYINLIREQGLQAWRYEEKKAVLEATFRYQEVPRPLDMVSHLVMNMQHYQEEDVIYGDYMMKGYDEALLREIIDQFVPENLRATLLAQGGDYTETANWYYTPYSVTPFTDAQFAYFHQTQSELSMTLPEPNPFICHGLQPKPIESDDDQPQIIQESDGFRLWHMQDQEFLVPKGVIYVAIDSPYAVQSPRNIVMTRLCVEIFLDSLAKETYPAEIAGMGYNMYTHQGGVTLSISGFSQKQPELLALILDRFKKREFSEHRFQSVRTQLERSWRNAAKDRPISQLFNAMTGLLQPNNPPYESLLAALQTIKVQELAPFVDQMLSQLHVEMFIYGDWRKSDALQIGQQLIQALHVRDQRYEESLRPLVMLGKQGTFRREVFCDQDDSAVVLYYQCADISPKSVALYSLANHLMSATFFHEIRTKQQLGYMVGTGNLPLNRHPGIVMYVQSPHAAPVDLIASIDEFLNAFYLVLLELNEYQWHSSKRGLFNQIAIPDPTLRSRAQRFWVAIGNKDHQFNQRELVLQELKQLSRSDMIRFVVNELKPRTANRLIMHTQGNAHHDAEQLTLGREIGSIEAFQLMPKAYELG
ncbi:Protease 3 precursor [Vibrio ruber DSM 16370]|uniref:Protease 3 n=1 Tax=Vibrio ruber (strain DSM 16370 / JCM 11486 / BCRC 17186 / CECT 7878 / LMG 23124 / VR1) TaxID=1123498 RepID=A0A1R4LDV4_VIBR1|nr:insulinase family protein [Vibrio ruber]SJN54732.1 Protease 3 precursor [Vibrio ruber DSM 16370]